MGKHARRAVAATLTVCAALSGVLAAGPALAQQWDTIRGAIETVEAPGPHWFLVRGRHTGYVIDGDSGDVKGTLTLSMFSPALESHPEAKRIYAYGSYYSRTYYGDRTDAVVFYDTTTLAPVDEVVIPPKSAGIGHNGMMGLVDDRFIGVWNITPAMSVSIVDTQQKTFVGEISTPGCAAVYPLGRGFLMPCGDGALQYIALAADGTEASRTRGEKFFDVSVDPVYDYALPTADGWLFLSFDGLVFEATVENGGIVVSEPWSIFGTDTRDPDGDTGWRIGGRQPFAYNAATGLLVTLMHEGGGQETFEDAGTELWAFDIQRKRRGYRLELDSPARAIGLTNDAEPLLVVMMDEGGVTDVRDGRTGALERTITDMNVSMMKPLL